MGSHKCLNLLLEVISFSIWFVIPSSLSVRLLYLSLLCYDLHFLESGFVLGIGKSKEKSLKIQMCYKSTLGFMVLYE